jgi:hypothetical protein
MVYLYAVTEPLSAAPAGTGVEGATLRAVSGSGLTAVVSDRDDASLVASEETLWAHERVVEALMDEHPALPMRFGSLLPDDDAVRDMVATRREELTVALHRVRGAVELGVRVAWDPDAPADDVASSAQPRGRGASYLVGLASARRRAGALGERLDRTLAGLSRTRVQRLLTSPTLPVTAAYLVDRERVEAFRRRVATLDAEVSDVEIVCTGPWPPYSFTGAPSG